MAGRWVLVQMKKIYIDCLEFKTFKFDIGELGCGTSFVQHLGVLKFSDK